MFISCRLSSLVHLGCIAKLSLDNASGYALDPSGGCVISSTDSLLTRPCPLLAFDESKYRSIPLIGVDEVGRGPLAGPVVAAAVSLPRGRAIEGLNDSKKLSAKRREELYVCIESNVDIAFALAFVFPEEIDRFNILQASLMAMAMAIEKLSLHPAHVLVDGNQLPPLKHGYTGEAIVSGDATSLCIAAASVVAKVSRDRYMREMAREYPGYGFDQNMGYGTRRHLEALMALGVTPIHRKSFAPVRKLL